MIVRAAALLVLALVATGAMAQWKWKDANGRVQYSDLPPPAGVAEKDILQRPAAARRVVAAPVPAEAASAAPAAAGTVPVGGKPQETELDVKRKQAEAAEAAKRKAEEQKVAAARAENCTRARGQQKLLDDGVRIARTGPTGEREILDDAQRAQESRRVREIIASDCK